MILHHPEIIMDFKKIVLSLAKLHSLPQSEIARRADMTPSNLQRVLNNVEGSRLSSLQRIAQAVGLEWRFQMVSAPAPAAPR